MNRNERRKLEREQSKSQKSIEIGVAQTLQQALQNAERGGAECVGFEGVFYIKVNGIWHQQDIVPELLKFPQYRKVYNEYRVKPDVGDLMARDILLVMFQSNLGNGGEYDISNQI